MSDDDDKNGLKKGDDGNEPVGYRHPPRHSRFKPGQSGNPRGRPKGTKNLRTDLREEGSERIPIREGEHVRRVSKQRAYVKSVYNTALQGKGRAPELLANLLLRVLGAGEADTEAEPLDSDDLEILRDYEEELRQRFSQEKTEDTPPKLLATDENSEEPEE